jgi:hypothetical protein
MDSAPRKDGTESALRRGFGLWGDLQMDIVPVWNLRLPYPLGRILQGGGFPGLQ